MEALRENELEKFKAKFNEQQYNLQMEYYQQLKERQEEVRSLRHDVKKYILAMQAVAEHGDTEELHRLHKLPRIFLSVPQMFLLSETLLWMLF